jgi:integrase
LLEVLYATGIRHAEAHKLDLYDVDTASHRLTVRLGKGQRDRVVPLTETAAQWLTRYVTGARPELAAGLWCGKGRRRGQPKLIAPTSALWLSVIGRRLSHQMIAERIRDYASRAEPRPRCTPLHDTPALGCRVHAARIHRRGPLVTVVYTCTREMQRQLCKRGVAWLIFDNLLSCGWVRGRELPVLNVKRTGC